MATASNSLPVLFAPLQAFAAWLSGDRTATRSDQISLPPRPLQTTRLPRPLPVVRAARPLRVWRVVEAGSRSAAGRMVISGRMADVCAELDRLAEREAQALQVRPPTR